MELKTEKMIVKKIVKKTRAKGLMEVKAGDVIQFVLKPNKYRRYNKHFDLIVNDNVTYPTTYTIDTIMNIKDYFDLEII